LDWENDIEEWVNCLGEGIALIDFLGLHGLSTLFTKRLSLLALYLSGKDREDLKEKLFVFKHLLDEIILHTLEVKDDEIIDFGL